MISDSKSLKNDRNKKIRAFRWVLLASDMFKFSFYFRNFVSFLKVLKYICPLDESVYEIKIFVKFVTLKNLYFNEEPWYDSKHKKVDNYCTCTHVFYFFFMPFNMYCTFNSKTLAHTRKQYTGIQIKLKF